MTAARPEGDRSQHEKAAWVSPRGFLIGAGALVLLYGVAHVLGLRDDASILSGTAPPSGAAGLALGIGYVLLYFAAVVGAPILVVGAAVFWVLDRLLYRPHARTDRASQGGSSRQ
jgi:hypothetical protein